jgi:hypothetical protein
MFIGNMAERILSQPIFFPEIYTAHRSDRDCHNKLCGEEALIAVYEAVFGTKRRSDLEYFQECVWIDITVTDGLTCLLTVTVSSLISRLILSKIT